MRRWRFRRLPLWLERLHLFPKSAQLTLKPIDLSPLRRNDIVQIRDHLVLVRQSDFNGV